MKNQRFRKKRKIQLTTGSSLKYHDHPYPVQKTKYSFRWKLQFERIHKSCLVNRNSNRFIDGYLPRVNQWAQLIKVQNHPRKLEINQNIQIDAMWKQFSHWSDSNKSFRYHSDVGPISWLVMSRSTHPIDTFPCASWGGLQTNSINIVTTTSEYMITTVL